jgi:hypothetical protein
VNWYNVCICYRRGSGYAEFDAEKLVEAKSEYEALGMAWAKLLLDFDYPIYYVSSSVN